MKPKASQNGAKIPPKCIIFPSSFSCRFFDRFREAFCSFSEGPDPRFACYLQGFRGVQLFSLSSEKSHKIPPKRIQNDSPNASTALQKLMQKRSRKKRRTTIENDSQNGAEMESKGSKFELWSPFFAPRNAFITQLRFFDDFGGSLDGFVASIGGLWGEIGVKMEPK